MPNINLRQQGIAGMGPDVTVVGATGYTPAEVGKSLVVQPDRTIAATGGAGVPAPAISQQVFVGKWGNDVTGDGSMSAPYFTVNHALTTILDAADLKRYEIVVFPGIYAEGAIALKPFIDIAGWNPSATLGFYPTQITAAYTLAATFSGATGQECRLSNLDVNGTVTLNYAAFPAANGDVTFNNCQFEGDISLTASINSLGAALTIYNSVILGNLTQVAGNVSLFNTSSTAFGAAKITVQPAAGAGPHFSAMGGAWAGDFDADQNAIDGVQVNCNLQGFSVSRGLVRLLGTALTSPFIKANYGDLPENVTLSGAAAVLTDQMRISHQFPDVFPNPTAIAATGTTTIDLVVPAALIGATNIETMQCSCMPVGNWGSFIGPHNCSVTFTYNQVGAAATIHINIYNPGAGFNITDLCNLNFQAYLPLVL